MLRVAWGGGGVSMRIRQLELIGFKSFPNRTVLDIPRGVTAVVGPNGCGKSNVVDAIRWVLGEQSPKQLRGDVMEAVVFNGNDRLPPLGMGEVSLTFENERPATPLTGLDLEVSTVPSHFRELPEIMVTRRYFRSGESEYFINKTPCRLKDITELFLGTGVGSKAYGIIEQGRVEQLINAKPEDRRLFIEEAAGTTLYRSRRLAAERKMERTRENLARVKDVLREIDRQVQYLERQAKKAEAYRRLSEDVRALELQIAGGQWLSLRAKSEELDGQRTGLETEETRFRTERDTAEQGRQAVASALGEAEQQQGARRERLAVLEAEQASVRERQQLLLHERDARERRRVRLAEELGATRLADRENAERLQQAEREREASVEYLRLDGSELSQREHELERARGVVAESHSQLEAAKGVLVDQITHEVEARNGWTGLERRRDDVARQLTKLQGEEAALAQRLTEIGQETTAGHDHLMAVRAQLTTATEEQESYSRQLRSLAETRRRWEREATELEGRMLQSRSRLESLERIQRDYEGFHRGVRAIMRTEHHADGVLGVVADVIDIPQEHECAVAAVLGDRLQYMIVRGEDDGAGAVDRLRQQASGRGSFIPLHPRPADLNGGAALNGTSKRLIDLVQFNESFRKIAESLLGDVMLVPDLDSAVALWRQNGVRVTLVTPEGDVVDPTGVITGGSDRPIEEEILTRRREIDTLHRGIETTSGQLAGVRQQLEQVTQAMSEAEAALKALDEGAHAFTVQIVAAEKDIERLGSERPQIDSRRDLARYEIGVLVADEQRWAEEGATLQTQLGVLSTQHQELEQAVSTHCAAADDAVAHAEAVSNEVTAVKVRLAERRERQQAAVATAESLRRTQGDYADRAQTIAQELGNTERERDDLDQGIAAARTRRTEQDQQRVTLQAAIESAADGVQRLAETLREAEQRSREIDELLEHTRTERNQIELARPEVRLRAEHLEQAMRERYAVELVDQVARDGGDTTADATAKLEELKGRLSRLGEVNVAAIDELRELEERSAFLYAQRDDLERSLADLERTIQKLNRASRTRFVETFARANETFQKVFPRLFRGGEGRLVLTDEHNLLETGVDIVVRPPGKRLDGVSLLSGGEKALVAVSLIFSLYLINPTPFCILDEVDAPLDDANIGRFSQMIREMSAHSQFIIITHNKRTMDASDVLYGITMQEPGVSKVISVSMT